jgi:hypothetical protein
VITPDGATAIASDAQGMTPVSTATNQAAS